MISLLLTLVVYNIASGFTKVMEVTQPAFMIVKRPEATHFECEIKNMGNAEDLKVTLFKEEDNGSIEICASVFTHTGIILGHKKENHRCQVYPGRDRVNVTLLGLQSSDAGLYICQIERISPPPYYPVKGKGTQLFVIDKDSCPDNHLYLWILVPVASGLLGYSILITIFIMTEVRKKRYYSPGAYEKMVPM
ncbi:cytotoxic T-lymphocyte protein 4 [Pantherophis guttatus]|uniref:Cytotoxic T-lymphocyte protein 4 n=1 Tax=Pantherophis guttatus TaxID=94885 RepID=A0A6P9CS31_PANGU|nr:cytotoxic T-lymphocyte protein 4 [Pantherophis guttatus]XP_034287273.1 cytotoxic T-lymphocyte protein 4 [Pantherophis guttatus]